MSAQWADDLHHALHVALTGETQGYYADFGGLSAVAKTLTGVFFHDGRWSSFRGTEWGTPVDGSVHDGRRFVGYLQTHDQVGNRALGDRISASLTPGQQAIGAALYLTSTFTPMVFMGEEWAASTPWQYFTDHQEPELAAAVAKGRREEFAAHGWDAADIPNPQDRSTRDASVLRWDEVTSGGHSRMLQWYRDLTRLRRQEPDLTDSRLDAVHVEFDEEAGWLTVRRGAVVVAANFAAHSQTVPVGGEVSEVLLAWDPNATASAANGVRIGPHGVVVVRT
jgi:maltooligosyltrehalose trehalohydrolase